MIPQPQLITTRLLLRPFAASDAKRVAELANDQELSRNLKSFDFPYSYDDACRWLGEMSGDWERETSATFAICNRNANEWGPEKSVMGSIGLIFDLQSNRGELGYWIGRRYWGNGLVTEAASAMLDFAFNQLGLNKVTAECLKRNPASARVMEKLGMAQEGYFVQHFRKNAMEEYCDVLSFGILRESWNSRE